METLFLVCAGGGGALILCQFLAGLAGFASDHDVHSGDADHDHDHDSQSGNSFFGWFTFRTIAAALAFFGLGGLSALYYQFTESTSLLIAIVSGMVALLAVAKLMKLMHKLKADGTVKIEKAIGQTGRVYLMVPGKKTGSGKVTLNLQNRTVECLAMTAENEIATGSTVQVVAVLGPNLVEVTPVPAA